MLNSNEHISFSTTATPPSRGSFKVQSLTRFSWLAPILVAGLVYGVAFNNFFTYDDFIWLNRARTLTNNWQQIFHPDVVYFDPLVHLLFRLNYVAGGLDPHWYHAVDLTIHAANSALLYRFARLLSGENTGSLFAGILFASSFALADAVIWPSSRVDLLSTFFSLAVLLQYLHYVRSGSKRKFYYAIAFFVLALGAKGTPLILPLVLFWLIILEQKPLRTVLSLTPFILIVMLYLALLKLSMHLATLPLDRLRFNLNNLAVAFCSMFIPEEMLSRFDVPVTTFVLFAIVFALVALSRGQNKSSRITKTGFCILCVALLPVLILSDFKLATKTGLFYNVLLSPSHRIYLASAGTALLWGGLLRQCMEKFLIEKLSTRTTAVMAGLVLACIVVSNAAVISQRNELWQSMGNNYEDSCAMLRSFEGKIAEGSQLALVNFPGSRGFLTPMVKICLGVENVSIIPVKFGLIEDEGVLEKAEKTYLLVRGYDGQLYDRTEQYRQQLLFNRLAVIQPDHMEYGYKSLSIANRLSEELKKLIAQK